MPKIGVISRSEKDFERDSKLDMNKIYRSTNANIHQFQKAREYQRAVVGAKIDRIFA
jgi:WD repeat and SOF domain-containing protein 1